VGLLVPAAALVTLTFTNAALPATSTNALSSLLKSIDCATWMLAIGDGAAGGGAAGAVIFSDDAKSLKLDATRLALSALRLNERPP